MKNLKITLFTAITFLLAPSMQANRLAVRASLNTFKRVTQKAITPKNFSTRLARPHTLSIPQKSHNSRAFTTTPTNTNTHQKKQASPEEHALFKKFLTHHRFEDTNTIDSYTITNGVITECNGFPLHLPLALQENACKKSDIFEEYIADPNLYPKTENDICYECGSLGKQYKDQPNELFFKALEPLQQSVCMSFNALIGANPTPGEMPGPIELQLLWKQTQKEIDIPTERHIPLKQCDGKKYENQNVEINANAIYVFNIALQNLHRAKNDKGLTGFYYGRLRKSLLHEATHLKYNDAAFSDLLFRVLYHRKDQLEPDFNRYQEHRADTQALHATECFICAEASVGYRGSDYLSVKGQTAIADKLKAEGKICPVHKRLHNKIDLILRFLF